jgi:hypothetical protein
VSTVLLAGSQDLWVVHVLMKGIPLSVDSHSSATVDKVKQPLSSSLDEGRARGLVVLVLLCWCDWRNEARVI